MAGRPTEVEAVLADFATRAEAAGGGALAGGAGRAVLGRGQVDLPAGTRGG